MTATTVRALSCTNCGGTIALRAAGITVSLVCEHCGTTLDATDPALRIIAQASEAMKRPEIPLGTRGDLRGTTWEVVGYMERSDGEAGWAEYLLFNPYRGYAFLIDDGRRFSLGLLMDRLPNHTGGAITVDEQAYSRFGSTYGTWVHFVVGEFYWRVAVDEHVLVTDFVRPGTMLSCEENDGERTWTRSDLLDRGAAEAAFGLPRRPVDNGGTPAPHEPSPYRGRMIEALIIGLVAIVTLFVIAIGASGHSRVTSAEIAVQLDGAATTRVIGPVELPAKSSAVGIHADVPQLDNSWIELDYSLVDRRTQQSFDVYATAESYHGRDSDGPWSEGNSRPDTRLSSIPRGSYDLVVEATGHRWQANSVFGATPIFAQSETIPVRITVERGGVFGGNVALALFLLLIWPVIATFKHWNFERRRMAPVTGSEDDE
ncbi:DUF4178 domain-containing protein [Sphingomonas sp. So64.6b]|uniref:DUF4178 domain-containing protein n=1 Tax=Sphingomonas sp. So64.6b TaxID=2997354 RepID=UPI00160151C7|nr:DUF4178 domain-containing protein [Sphingomonas sp. So64.6b]QNA83556.1 DUF4178 domain-containing protein [Sphingomonas sp. So64.6b]